MNGSNVVTALGLLVLAILDLTNAMPTEMQAIYEPFRPMFLLMSIMLVIGSFFAIIRQRKNPHGDVESEVSSKP